MRHLIFSLLLSISFVLSASAQDKTIKRDSFSLSYPADWAIDTTDEDYDPDALFSIDSPDGESFIMFIIYNIPIDGDELLEAQVSEFTAKLIKKPVITNVNQWGKYKVKGKVMKGKIAGVYKGYVKIYVYEDEFKTMLVVEQGYDEAASVLDKGYKAISSSFRFARD